MLPRRQIREAFYLLFQQMKKPKTAAKGRLHRFLDQDLPAINITTFNDQVLTEDRVHRGCKQLDYSQAVTIELHMHVRENFEDDLDAFEEEFWEKCSSFNIAGVDLQYNSGELTPLKDVENPQVVKLLYFTATYSVDSREPDVIIT